MVGFYEEQWMFRRACAQPSPVPDLLTDLLDGPWTCTAVFPVSSPVSGPASCCSWLDGLQTGITSSPILGLLMGPVTVTNLVPLRYCRTVPWSGWSLPSLCCDRCQLLPHLPSAPVLLLLLPDRLCPVESIVWIIFNNICFIVWNNWQVIHHRYWSLG